MGKNRFGRWRPTVASLADGTRRISVGAKHASPCITQTRDARTTYAVGARTQKNEPPPAPGPPGEKTVVSRPALCRVVVSLAGGWGEGRRRGSAYCTAIRRRARRGRPRGGHGLTARNATSAVPRRRATISLYYCYYFVCRSLSLAPSFSLAPSRSPRPRVNLAATTAAHGSVSSGPTVSHGPPHSVRAIIMFFFFVRFHSYCGACVVTVSFATAFRPKIILHSTEEGDQRIFVKKN